MRPELALVARPLNDRDDGNFNVEIRACLMARANRICARRVERVSLLALVIYDIFPNKLREFPIN